MKILVLNCGSSSIKYKLFDMDRKEVIAQGGIEKIGLKDSFLKFTLPSGEKKVLEKDIPEHTVGVEFILNTLTSPEYGAIKSLDEINAVGHRMVHGGEKFSESVRLTPEVLAAFTACNDLAPLHNPANLKGVNAISAILPNVPQIGVFDTAFHQTMPKHAYLYAVPYELYEKYGVRRYGFHGTSHRYVSQRVCEFLGVEPEGKKIITCHIGNGGSITAIMDGFLLLKFWANDELVYMMPIGNGDLTKVLDALVEDAHREGEPFCLLGICSGMCSELEAFMPGKFQFTADRDYADYLYLRTDLATLAGKKFQSKRNHVNKFKRTYNYEYTPITPDRIQECLDLEAEWCKANNCDQHEGTGNERRALVYALHNFEELGLTGGILHVDGKIAAFTFGMPINQDTFGVHVEKADTSIDGAYAMINYEFANHIPEQYVYLNREEDLGIEGLRKAKLSYQPAIILEKYVACLKDEPVEAIKW